MSNPEAATEIGIGADRPRTRVAIAVDHVLGNIRKSGRAPYRVLAGFFGAWALFFAILYLLPKPAELSVEGHRVLAIVTWVRARRWVARVADSSAPCPSSSSQRSSQVMAMALPPSWRSGERNRETSSAVSAG